MDTNPSLPQIVSWSGVTIVAYLSLRLRTMRK